MFDPNFSVYLVWKANNHEVGYLITSKGADAWGLACRAFPRLKNPSLSDEIDLADDWRQQIENSGIAIKDMRGAIIEGPVSNRCNINCDGCPNCL